VKWIGRIALLAIVIVSLPRAIVLTVGLYGLLFPPQVPVVFYLLPQQVVPGQAVKLPEPAIKALFTEFSAATSFAAFAADTTGHWAFTSGRHSPEAARTQALARCGKDCVVMFEHRPRKYRDDSAVQTVSQEAALGIALAIKGKPQSQAIYYALGDQGSWAVQTAADGAVLPQWAVLNRCRVLLDHSDTYWPPSLPNPQCRLFRGIVGVVLSDGAQPP
jgi:hypothetical protein